MERECSVCAFGGPTSYAIAAAAVAAGAACAACASLWVGCGHSSYARGHGY